MAMSLEDYIARLPEAERAKIKARTKELRLAAEIEQPIQEVIRDMVDIINDDNTDPEDKELAFSTIIEALSNQKP